MHKIILSNILAINSTEWQRGYQGADVELEPQTEAADWPVAHKSILIS